MQFVEGKTTQEVEKVRIKMQEDVDFLMKENTALGIEMNEVKRKFNNLAD